RLAARSRQEWRSSSPPEQPGGAPHQQYQHHQIDQERAELGNGVFAGDIADADQRRSRERSPDRAQPADRDYEQHADQVREDERRRSAQRRRHLYRLLDRAIAVGRGRNRDERKPDGEQHLIELARPVEPPVERALEYHADQRGEEERERQGREERPAETVHQRD